MSESTRFGRAVGHSLAMRRVFAMLERAAATDATVLIEGESGTGKELLARGVHEHSPRRKGPFVVFDCGSVAAALLESELFGHAKGAFTGAGRERPGLVESASGGTLFLDEIGEMPLELQTRLLGVLERRTTRRVGTNEDREVDVRFVAATNRDLRQEVNEGHFRADLWHRLSVVRVVVPPLRARPEDIAPIAQTMFEELRAKYPGRFPAALGEDELSALRRHRWNGNLRELRNHLEAAVVLSTGGHLKVDVGAAREGPGPSDRFDPGELAGSFHEAKERLNDLFDRAYLQQLLQRHPGNLSAAAREAGLSRMHLRRLLRRHQLESRDRGRS